MYTCCVLLMMVWVCIHVHLHCSRNLISLDAFCSTLRIDYCDEWSDYKEGDISGPKGAIVINEISIESPDVAVVYEII